LGWRPLSWRGPQAHGVSWWCGQGVGAERGRPGIDVGAPRCRGKGGSGAERKQGAGASGYGQIVGGGRGRGVDLGCR